MTKKIKKSKSKKILKPKKKQPLKTSEKKDGQNINSNINHTNIVVPNSKTTRRISKSKPIIKKVEGVSSIVPYYYKPPQNIITQPLYYNRKDNKNFKVHNDVFQTPEIKSTNLNTNSNNLDDYRNSTLSINDIGSIYGNDDDYNTVSKQLPHSVSTHHLQDHYEIKEENLDISNSFIKKSLDSNFQDQQPQDNNF